MKVATFAERLKEAMETRRINQTELHEKTGIGKPSISTYLKGDYQPKQDKVDIIATALSVNPAWLMGYSVPMELSEEGYYSDQETAEYAEELRTNSDLRVLFSASRDLSKKQMQEAYDYIKYLKSKETHNDD